MEFRNNRCCQKHQKTVENMYFPNQIQQKQNIWSSAAHRYPNPVSALCKWNGQVWAYFKLMHFQRNPTPAVPLLWKQANVRYVVPSPREAACITVETATAGRQRYLLRAGKLQEFGGVGLRDCAAHGWIVSMHLVTWGFTAPGKSCEDRSVLGRRRRRRRRRRTQVEDDSWCLMVIDWFYSVSCELFDSV